MQTLKHKSEKNNRIESVKNWGKKRIKHPSNQEMK